MKKSRNTLGPKVTINWGSPQSKAVVALWKKMLDSSLGEHKEEENIGTIYVKGSGDITVEFSDGKKVSLKKDVNGKVLVDTIFAEAAKSLLSRSK